MSERPFPKPPEGRYRRMWSEFEVEIVDETALRAHLLSSRFDAKGNDLGPHIPEGPEALSGALARVIAEALHAAGDRIGVKFVSLGGPLPRYLSSESEYAELTIPSIPQRRDDGSYDALP